MISKAKGSKILLWENIFSFNKKATQHSRSLSFSLSSLFISRHQALILRLFQSLRLAGHKKKRKCSNSSSLRQSMRK